jgi:lysophospholipase
MTTQLKNTLRIVCMVALLSAMVIGLPLPGHAVPEAELPAAFATRIKPFFDQQFSFGSFPGTGGVSLRYAKRVVPDQRGVLVVVDGRTEFLAKYAELLYDLRDLPLSVYIFDQRGQGASGRLLPDHDKGYVRCFKDYVNDLAIFIDTVVQPDRKVPLFILSHSTGGLVAGLYANGHPDSVQGLILCAPMLGLHTAPFPTPIARLLAWSATRLDLGGRYVPGGGPYNPAFPFSANVVTHSKARFALNQRLVAISPGNALGSPTYSWVNQAFVGMDRLAANHRQLKMPVLLLSAGEDSVVDNKAEAKFCRTLPSCTLITMPGSRHEILMEEDSIRNRALALIREFVARHISPAKEGSHER